MDRLSRCHRSKVEDEEHMTDQLTSDLAMIARNAIDKIIELEKAKANRIPFCWYHPVSRRFRTNGTNLPPLGCLFTRNDYVEADSRTETD